MSASTPQPAHADPKTHRDRRSPKVASDPKEALLTYPWVGVRAESGVAASVVGSQVASGGARVGAGGSGVQRAAPTRGMVSSRSDF
jgi:hypothetical protein